MACFCKNRKTRPWRGRYTKNKKRISKFFDTQEEAEEWERINREIIQNEKQITKDNTDTTELRKKNVEKHGGNRENESKAIQILYDLIKNKYDCLLIRDGSHNDIALKKKTNTTNLYHAIQIKSASKKELTKRAVVPRASFGMVNHYPNSIVLCICLYPLQMWIFHGKDLIHKGQTLHESQKQEFKDALIYDQEAQVNNIFDKLNEYLKHYPKKEIEYWNTQLTTSHYLEYKANLEYQKFYNISLQSFKPIGSIEHLVYDLIQNGQRIQEKTCYTEKGKTGFKVHLNKCGGKINGKKKLVPYEKDDFDVLRIYVLYTLDENNSLVFDRDYTKIKYSETDDTYKKEIKKINSYKLFGYFEIPMTILINQKLIKTSENPGQKTFKVHLPEQILIDTNQKLPQKNIKLSTWTRPYFNDDIFKKTFKQ